MTETLRTSARPSYRPFAVEVRAVADLSPTFRRLTLTGPDLAECGDALVDQRVKVVLAEPSADLLGPDWYAAWRGSGEAPPPVMRTYTLSGIDREAGTVDIDFACRPAHGPASRFAQAARPGTRFVLVGPDALSPAAATDGIAWRPGSARQVLLVGDETALPAVRNILRVLPADTFGEVVLDLPSEGDAIDLAGPARVRITVLHRDPRGVGVAAAEVLAPWFDGDCAPPETTPPAATRPVPIDPDADLLWDEADPSAADTSYAWCAGEAGWMTDLRRRHRRRAVPGRAVSVMGYWRSGQVSPG